MIGVGSIELVNEICSRASSVVGVVVAAAFKCFAAFVFGWADCTGSGRGDRNMAGSCWGSDVGSRIWCYRSCGDV